MRYKKNTVSASTRNAISRSHILTSPFSILFLITLALLPMLVLGCSNGTTGDSSSGYTIKIFSNDTQIASLSFDDLLKLPQVNVSASGRTEEGPTLLSALALANVINFSQITATGMTQGRIAEAELTLTRAQIDDQVILDITNSGTAKLCGPAIDFNNWIRDVNKLVVK